MTLDRHGYAVLGLIYDAAMDEARRREALDAVSKASGAIGGALLIAEREERPYSIQAVGGVYATMAQADMRYYVEHLSHLESGEWQALAATHAQQPLIDSEVGNPTVLDQRADYLYLREQAGVGRRIGVRLNENPAWYDAITVVFGSRHPAMAARSRPKLAPLLPHLAKAVEMGRAFSRLRARYAAVLAVLDKVHVGLAIANAAAEVLVCNTEANRILGLADGMVLSKERRIICRYPDQTAALDAFVQEAACTAGGQANRSESLIAIPRPTGSHPVLVEVAPLSDSLGEIDVNLVGAVITLIDPEHTPHLDIGRLAALHELTPAEAAVCAHMVNGLTGPAIAELRAASIETVKSQMAAVLAKTSVARRSELIQLVVWTLPPIG